MSSDDVGSTRSQELPEARIDWLTKPVARFLRIEAAAGVILLLSAAAALILSNSPWAQLFAEMWEIPLGVNVGSIEFERTLRGWINDGLMTLFFFLVSLELKRELVLGELRKPRMAALSIAAALGGMIAPALIYVSLQAGEPAQHGWGTVMATDTAFVVGCLALLGRRIPQSMRVFMLSLAIVDDIGAILVVAIGYGHEIQWQAIGAAAIGFAVVWGASRLGVRRIALYFLLGIFTWAAVDASGIHATVTGVLLGLMTPTGRWVSDRHARSILENVLSHAAVVNPGDGIERRRSLHMAKVAARETLSPVEQLELMLHPWVAFVIMPIFALANAGVSISLTGLTDSVTVAIFAGFVLGKPLGILSFGWLAVRTGIATRPADLDWTLLAAGGMLAGIGFTMALFIANLAFSPVDINAAKLGILSASVFAAVAGLALLSVWAVRDNRAKAKLE